jgi:hypothetical protein
MPGKNKPPQITLPKSWGAHVKTAILQVVAQAQYALAYSRSWAADSSNQRVRLKAPRDARRQNAGGSLPSPASDQPSTTTRTPGKLAAQFSLREAGDAGPRTTRREAETGDSVRRRPAATADRQPEACSVTPWTSAEVWLAVPVDMAVDEDLRGHGVGLRLDGCHGSRACGGFAKRFTSNSR